MISSNQRTEKKLRIQLLVVLALWVFIGFALVVFLDLITDDTNNELLLWFDTRLDLIYIIYIIVGFIVIFYCYWKKPWNYLNEVVDAMEMVYEKSVNEVTLSSPLQEVERRLSQIKMSITSSEKSVAQAEIKKNELVMYLAHDIRTPLTTVIGYLNLIEEAQDMPPAQRNKYIRIALNKAERMDVLINELFDLTRYNSNAISLNRIEIDLSLLLRQITDEFYPVLSANENTIEIESEDNLSISADTEMIARAFGNLLKNAATYSDKGSVIHLSTKRDNDSVIIIFENTGDTISQEDLQALFDKFNRLDQARMSKTGGAGLGLPIAKEIVELHGGTITAQSKDRTISFFVRLPIVR